MENIIFIKGNVEFPITLDPGVWIFDDRRVDLLTYFEGDFEEVNEIEEYTKEASKHWDREIVEGAIFPPTIKTEKKFEKERVLTGSFGVPFKPFLKNANPNKDAHSITVETEGQEYTYSLEEAQKWILAFSKDGKPLKEDGPIHIYFGDGSNYECPIKNVKAFKIE